MKQVVVIGLGTYGAIIAKKLSAMGIFVLGIDKDPEKVYNISALIKSTVIGDAKNKSFIEEHIDKKTEEVVICVGSNMVDSLMIVHHLNEMNIKHIVVKANDCMQAELLKSLGTTDVLVPQNIIADCIALRIVEQSGEN